MFTVFIEGLDFYAYHGVPSEERKIGHRYQVDIELKVIGTADSSDQISDTVDYAEAARLAESIVRETQFHTVERLAGAIGEKLLASFPSIHSASVCVRKPLPPAPIIAAAVGATVMRSR